MEYLGLIKVLRKDTIIVWQNHTWNNKILSIYTLLGKQGYNMPTINKLPSDFWLGEDNQLE